MAQLKNSVVNGDLVVTDSTLTDSLQVTTVIAPVSSGSYSYGTGENGQALRSNGTTAYWGNLPTYQGMTESEIDDGTGDLNRTISPKNLKYAVREYETVGYDNMMQLYYNGYTTMNILDCNGISSATQKTSFDMEFNNEVLEGTYEFAAYIQTLSSVTSCTITFYDSNNSSVGTCQLTTNSASAHVTVDLSDTAVKMTLSFASSTTIGIESFGLFPKLLWNYVQKHGFIIDMVQRSLPTPLMTQKLNKLRSDYDDVKGENVFVGTCASAASSQTKAVTVSNDQNFELKKGVQIAVKFSVSNTYSATASAPCKLNVNSTGAYNIWWTNTGTPTGTNTTAFGTANYYHYYTFDGTYWIWTGYSNHSNTTYSGMTVAEINAGTSTTNRLISPANLKTAVNTYTEPLSDVVGNVVDGKKKNLLQLSGKDVTGYGVKCTFDYENGTIHLDGINTDKKCTGAFNIQIAKPSMLNLVAGKTYSFTCEGYETSTTTLGLYVYTSGSGQFDTYESSQCAWVSAWNNDNSTGSNGFRLFIRQNTVIDNITLTPMICEVDEYNVSSTVVPYTSMDKRLQACMIREVDNGKKNFLMTNNGSNPSGSSWIDIPVDLPSGEYVIHFDSLTSTDTDATTCQCICFGPNYEESSGWYHLSRGNDITSSFIVTSHASMIRLYPSDSYTHSSGDTVTFTNAMLCTRNDWDISTRYMPYKIDPDNTYKNILRPTLTGTFSENGISAVTYGNGGVRIYGTSTAQTVIPIGYCTLKPNTVYYAHGIHGGSSATFFLNWNWQTSASAANANIYSSGTKINSSTSERGVYVTAYVRSGVTLNTIMFPMICSESDYLASPIYEPYVSNPDIYNNIIKICYGTDLDNMRYPGTYQSPNSTISASLSNSPITGAGFILEVFNTGNIMQRLTPIAATAGMGKYFVRSRTSSGWGDWVIFEASSQ